MKVVQTAGPGKLEITDAVAPRVGRGPLVRLERAGICGTDRKILDGSIPIDYPRVLGHEMVGTVVAGAPGGRISVGTKVMVNPGTFCGKCHLCAKDRPHLCPHGGLRGRDSDGVFAESLEVSERFLHIVPDQVTWDEAGLLQVLGTVVHSQQAVDVSSETVAVVIGLGVSGMLHMQLLSERGVSRVIGISRSGWKLELATNLGARAVATPDEAAQAVAEVSEGRGADLVIEAVGTESTVWQAIELCSPGGNVIIYGTVAGAAKMPYYQLYYKEITVHNPRAARPRDYDAAIGLAAAGRITLAALITARYPLKEAASAFAAAGHGHLKVLLTP